MKLEKIAHISSGKYVSSQKYAEKKEDYKKCYFLNVKDFDEAGNYLHTATEMYVPELLAKQDVNGDMLLFSVRGRFQAYYLPEVKGEQFIVSHSFVIIEVDKSKIMKEYLRFILNSSKMQHFIEAIALGNENFGHVNIKILKELEIPLPTLEKQKIIANLFTLKEKEMQLRKEILEKRNVLIESTLNNFIYK